MKQDRKCPQGEARLGISLYYFEFGFENGDYFRENLRKGVFIKCTFRRFTEHSVNIFCTLATDLQRITIFVYFHKGDNFLRIFGNRFTFDRVFLLFIARGRVFFLPCLINGCLGLAS